MKNKVTHNHFSRMVKSMKKDLLDNKTEGLGEIIKRIAAFEFVDLSQKMLVRYKSNVFKKNKPYCKIESSNVFEVRSSFSYRFVNDNEKSYICFKFRIFVNDRISNKYGVHVGRHTIINKKFKIQIMKEKFFNIAAKSIFITVILFFIAGVMSIFFPKSGYDYITGIGMCITYVFALIMLIVSKFIKN